jgi:hypothetical protein
MKNIKLTTTPTAFVRAIAVHDTEANCFELRGVDRGGVSPASFFRDDLTDVSQDLETNEVFISDESSTLIVTTDDGVVWLRGVLGDVAEIWNAAKDAERIAAAAAYTAIRFAAADGVPEAEIARIIDVDRMTVRRALGKR